TLMTKLDHPRVVCTSDRCKATYDLAGLSKVHYPTHCHERCHCQLGGIKVDRTGHKKLKRCTSINFWKRTCKTCHCSYQQHRYVLNETKLELGDWQEDRVKSDITNLDDLAELTEQLALRWRNDLDTILKAQAIFEAYLDSKQLSCGNLFKVK